MPEHGHERLVPGPSLVPEPAYVQHPVRQISTAGAEGTQVVEQRVAVLVAELLFVVVAGLAAAVAAGLATVTDGGRVHEDGGN